MKPSLNRYDVIVIGSGPAGQKAAIQAAKAGRMVAVVERDRVLGGACVYRGTIPSKTLREVALQVSRARRASGALKIELPEGTGLAELLGRVHHVTQAHGRYMTDQVTRNRVRVWHGEARLVSQHEVEVTAPGGNVDVLTAETIVLASGSVPREPPNIPIDHEHILDSDSLLSLRYLPRSLTVLGAGVIACEYATIFAELGVEVTIVDRGHRPVSFMDTELTDELVRAFQRGSGSYMPGRHVESVTWDGATTVTTLVGGEEVRSEKCLVALGRIANVAGLGLDEVGVLRTPRGQVAVDAHYRTSIPTIYAVGDVIGFPALAATSMQQGMQAMRHALGLDPSPAADVLPIGIYTIPALASVGLTEAEAIAKHGGARIGRALFAEVARGQIAGSVDGVLKLISDVTGERLLGVHVVGDQAAELVHIGQMALMTGQSPDFFLDTTFNFPTFAEAYRIAALDLANQQAILGEEARQAA